jgi:hypothetical protein
MQTKRITLGSEWQLLGRGPAAVQIFTQGIALVYLGSSAPAPDEEGHHLLNNSQRLLSYGGTANVYAKAMKDPVTVTVSATTMPAGEP